MTKIDAISITNKLSFTSDQNKENNINIRDNKESDNKELKKSAKYLTGAAALATAIIAGIAIAKNIQKGKAKKAEKIAKEAVESEHQKILQKANKEVESEKQIRTAIEKEDKYFNKTYKKINKSARHSAEAFEEFETTRQENQQYVANLKKSLRSKTPVNSETIDARLNPKNSDLEALNDQYRTIVGEEAAKREQAYIDKTYNSVNKSAKESAEIFEQHFKSEEAINKFKEKYAKLLPTLKLGEKDKFVYENGEVYIQKADGSIIKGRKTKKIYNIKLQPRPYMQPRPYIMPTGNKMKMTIKGKKTKSIALDASNNGPIIGKSKSINLDSPTCDSKNIVLDDPNNKLIIGKSESVNLSTPACDSKSIVLDDPFDELIITGKKTHADTTTVLCRFIPLKQDGKNILVNKFEYTPNGIIRKTHYGKNPRIIEVDKKLGEFSIEKDGYKYYYSINGRELLDIKEIKKGGKLIELGNYKPPKKGSNDGDDTPEIILIKLRGGKTAQLYKMPNGKILTPFEFHFPGAAKARKDTQEYLKQLEQLREHERQQEIIAQQRHKSIKSKEKEVIKYR